MNIHKERTSKLEPILAVSALLAASVASSVVLFYPLFKTQKVSVQAPDPSASLGWISEIRLNLERSVAQEPVLASLMEEAPVQKTVKKSVIRRISKAKKKSAKVAAAPREISYEDRVAVIRASIDREYFSEAPFRMEDAYRSLRNTFLVAVNTQDEPSQILFAEAKEEEPEKTEVVVAPKVEAKKKMRRHAKRVVSAAPTVPTAAPTSSLLASTHLEIKDDVPEYSKGLLALKIHGEGQVQTYRPEVLPVSSQSLMEQIQAQTLALSTVPESPKSIGIVSAVHDPDTLIDINEVLPANDPTQPAANSIPSVNTQNMLSAGPGSLTLKTSGPAQPLNEYSSHPEYSPGQSQTRQPVQKATEKDHKGTEKTHFTAAAATRNRAKFIDALDQESAVTGVSSSVLSEEGSTALDHAKWIVSEATGYLPTLSLRKMDSTGTPMLSLNMIHWLAMGAKIHQQKDLGVLLVQLAPGWSSKLSGRVESEVLLDEFGKVLGDLSKGAAAYSLQLNVEPGGHLLHLNHAEKSASGSIGVPVLPGKMTYVPLDRVSVTDISGLVLDAAGSNGPQAVANVHVSTVDHSRTSFSGKDGKFKLERVALVEDHPVVLESDFGEGFTHRYQIARNELRGVALYRFAVSQMNQWVEQLEGGISPKSGVVVAAVPEAVLSVPEQRLFPTTTALLSGGLTSETYTLSPKGNLKPRTELSTDSSRFISIQLSDGFHLLQLRNPEGQIFWSDLIRVSPDVISVVRSR